MGRGREGQDRERHRAEVARAAGSDAEDAVVFAGIEERHRELEQAQADNERVRYLSFIVGGRSAHSSVSR